MKFVFSVGFWMWMVLAMNAQTLQTSSINAFAGFKPEWQYHVMARDPFRYALTSVSMPLISEPSGGIYSVNHLPGLFCRLEYKLEMRSKLAPRIRLGSLRYANWMEGKLPAWSMSGY